MGDADDRKRVLIVCQLDGYANSVKPLAVQRFLQERGQEVRLVDTYFLSKTRTGAAFALLALGAAWSFVIRHSEFGRRRLSYYVLVANHRLRRRILRSFVRLDDFDLIVCETSLDAGVLTVPTTARTLLDSPTPWADEMYLEGQLTEKQHAKLRRFEADIFEHVDYLSFHWESYARYAVDQYGISGSNLITLNAGCTPATERAEFDSPPRIVYLGSLRSKFIDLPLLSRLTKMYPHIDVYGGPAPDPALGLNYLGYAPPTVLQRYQIGLITCTRDELRRSGFSAKHPQYLEYGLPVLVPAWRRSLDLLRGSVTYEEHTFPAVIETLSHEEEWRRVSDDAYAQAQRLTWDETLRPLDEILRSPSPLRPPMSRTYS